MRLALHVVLSSLVAWGCGCATSYRAGENEGFSDMRLGQDIFSINFQGNAFTRAKQVEDFAMLRAAEVTAENGFLFFAILKTDNTTDVSSVTVPGTATYSGAGSYARGVGTYAASGVTVGPQTSTTVTARSSLLIRCYTQKPDAVPVLDAAVVKGSIQAKYKMAGECKQTSNK
jgi:hypothetical protein